MKQVTADECAARCVEVNELLDQDPPVTGPIVHYNVDPPANPEFSMCYRVIFTQDAGPPQVEGDFENWTANQTEDPTTDCDPNGEIYGRGLGGGNNKPNGDSFALKCWEGCDDAVE